MRNLRIYFVVLLFLALLLSVCGRTAGSRKSSTRHRFFYNPVKKYPLGVEINSEIPI